MWNNIFDLVVIATLLYFSLRGISSGFVIEAAGIFSLVGAFWAARTWNEQLAPYLGFVSDPAWRPVIACVVIFIVVMLAIGLLARILKKLLAFSFAGWLDKLGGFALGLAKGILVWALVFIILEKIFHDAQFLRDSRVAPYFSVVIEQIKSWLPADIARQLGA